MDDRIRVSDADRDRVTSRLREHFAEGRLTADELDERISVALNAKTFGDLRQVTADLPGPAHVPPQAAHQPPPAAMPWAARRHRPRILPLILLGLLVALLIPGHGWLAFAFFKLLLVFWLVACVAGIFLAGRFHRRVNRGRRAGYTRCTRW
jgi:uncharacterized protein DUF1707